MTLNWALNRESLLLYFTVEKLLTQKLFEPYTTRRLNKKVDILDIRVTYTALLND